MLSFQHGVVVLGSNPSKLCHGSSLDNLGPVMSQLVVCVRIIWRNETNAISYCGFPLPTGEKMKYVMYNGVHKCFLRVRNTPIGVPCGISFSHIILDLNERAWSSTS